MAIKGISDVRRLPIIGQIRLGEKRKNERGIEFPSKLDYMNLKDAPAVAKVYGDKPRELDIMFPVDDENVIFNQALKAYRLSGLFCSCSDMVTASRVRVGKATESSKHHKVGDDLDPEGEKFIAEQGLQVKVNERFQLPCPGAICGFRMSKMCKGIGRLIFMIPSVPQFGCFVVSTTSFHSMVDVNSMLDAIRNVAGRVSNIPLKLRLVPKNVQPGGKKSTVFVLKIEFAGTVADLRQYRDNPMIAAPLPVHALPSREDLDKTMPDDLVPHAGATLSEQVGDPEIIEEGQGFGDAQDPPEDSTPPAQQAAAALQEPAPQEKPKPKPAPKKATGERW